MTFQQMIDDLTRSGINLYDVALYRGGQIHTHRFQQCANCPDSYSIAKAFIMTAVGLLHEEGRLTLSMPVCAFFPGSLPADMDPGWRLVTVEHALTHRLGLDHGFLDIDKEDPWHTTDFLSQVLRQPLRHLPGTHYQYSDAATYLLSRVVEQVAGMPVDAFLQQRLLTPMGFHEVAWSRCPEGHVIGATGLYLGAEDMVKLAALYLEDGRYQDRQLLSPDWVRRAVAMEYEFHVMTPGGLIGKGGLYGQALVYSREHHYALAVHAHDEQEDGERLIAYLDGMDEWTDE